MWPCWRRSRPARVPLCSGFTNGPPRRSRSDSTRMPPKSWMRAIAPRPAWRWSGGPRVAGPSCTGRNSPTVSCVDAMIPSWADPLRRPTEQIGLCLVAGLKLCGLDLELERSVPSPVGRRATGGAGGGHGPCFASAARWEVKCRGRKLVGSAQRRMGGGILQHGSIPMGPEYRMLHSFPETPAATTGGVRARQAAVGGQAPAWPSAARQR